MCDRRRGGGLLRGGRLRRAADAVRRQALHRGAGKGARPGRLGRRDLLLRRQRLLGRDAEDEGAADLPVGRVRRPRLLERREGADRLPRDPQHASPTRPASTRGVAALDRGYAFCLAGDRPVRQRRLQSDGVDDLRRRPGLRLGRQRRADRAARRQRLLRHAGRAAGGDRRDAGRRHAGAGAARGRAADGDAVREGRRDADDDRRAAGQQTTRRWAGWCASRAGEACRSC